MATHVDRAAGQPGLCNIGQFYEMGYGVAGDNAEAICYHHKCAAAARVSLAASHLR